MTDIVERLRTRDAYLSLDEAADEIERLRVEVAFYRQSLLMIHGVRVDGSSTEVWLRELAREALNGVDPRTGKMRGAT